MKKVIIYTDGGSRGNPGPSAAAYILRDEGGRELEGKGFFLGDGTNNTAEYTAVLKALEAAGRIGAEEVEVFSDSQLLVRQLNGQYKVKSELLRPLFLQARSLLGGFGDWKIRHIDREKNHDADAIVNLALDGRRDVELKKKCAAANEKTIRLGVLMSGGGRTLMNLRELIMAGRLNATVDLVISSRSQAGGVRKAKKAGLNLKIIRKKDFPDIDEFSRRIEEELISADIDLVVQAGWLCLWKIPQGYENRVMNIHPALLPSFGGKGMWGHHVHEAVLEAGVKVSGCSVHFCTNEYDVGPIIVQRGCVVREDDSAESLARRIFEEECKAYPQAIKLFAEDRLTVENGRVKIR